MKCQFPERVRIVEVGPRDGLQNEPDIIPAASKIQFIKLLADAGFVDIEATSFVHPARVPQLADAEEVFRGITQSPNHPTRYSALVPNRRGLERAIKAGVQSIAFFTAASETFTQKNIGMSIAESLDVFREMMPDARSADLRVRAYVSTAFVCPYEGQVAPQSVLHVAKELLNLGVDEISIGDTIGRATPLDVARLTELLLPTIPIERLAYHFHDTLGFALANVMMALLYKVSIFDSSAGGVGGCPFAPGAAGNVATEDLVAMLHGMGIQTGIDLAKVVAASQFLQQTLSRPLPARQLKLP